MRSSKSGPVRHPHRRTKVAGGTEDRISAGASILGAIEEATEILRSEGFESDKLTIRSYKVPLTPPSYRPGDVKRVRELLGASQAVLAAFLGVNVNTVRSWEQGKRLPQPIASRFLSEIETDIPYWRQRIENKTVEGKPANRSGDRS
jgi:putative transcriptional regulator